MSWEQRVVSMILDIMKHKLRSRERYRKSFAKGKVTFRETSVSRCIILITAHMYPFCGILSPVCGGYRGLLGLIGKWLGVLRL